MDEPVADRQRRSVEQESAAGGFKHDVVAALTKSELDALMSPFDLKRLDSYANNMLDYHVILDLLPVISGLYFSGRLPVKLSGVQSSIILAVGLQRKTLDALEQELSLPSSQLLAMFVKCVRKVSTHLQGLVEDAIAETMPEKRVSREEATGVHDDEMVDERFQPLAQALDRELEEGGDEAMAELREKQRAMIDSLPLEQ